jgi:hypothetical protein
VNADAHFTLADIVSLNGGDTPPRTPFSATNSRRIVCSQLIFRHHFVFHSYLITRYSSLFSQYLPVFAAIHPQPGNFPQKPAEVIANPMEVSAIKRTHRCALTDS